MKRIALSSLLAMLILLSQSGGQEPVKRHVYGTGQAFEQWGSLSENQKVWYMSGFIGGLGSAPSFEDKEEPDPVLRAYLECITKESISTTQLAAVVDKLYKESPKFWNLPMNLMVGSAIDGENSPCKVPYKAP
jgi:hypothetical protein